ncbi:MAG: enoyl-CoA hydratase-related protein [Microbacterium sp.]
MTIDVFTPADGIRQLTFNRPEKRNAITSAMYTTLAGGLAEADADPSTRVIVLTGAGGFFTAGNDLGDFRPGADASDARRFLHAIVDCATPIVVAVEGVCVGVGTTLLQHSDFVYAGERTIFALPFTKLGLTPEGGSSQLLPRRAGRLLANRLLLLGEKFDAATAQRAGLVTDVVPDGRALDAALECAQKLLALPPEALTDSLHLLADDRDALHELIDQEIEVFVSHIASAEFAKLHGLG